MTGLTSLTRDTLPISGSDLADALEAEILKGRWKAAERMPSERGLAAAFAVSRPVVREALRALKERGLITVAAGRGSFVKEVRPTSDGGDPDLLARRGGVTARHLVVARSMLEAEAAALAAENRSSADLADMHRILEAFEQARGVAKAANLDVAFHESIAVAARNPVIQLMFGSIRNLTHGVVLRSLTDRALRGVAIPLHSVILDAVANQDPDAARRAMTDHIRTAERYYGPDLDAALADVLTRRAAQIPDLASVLREVSESITYRPPASLGRASSEVGS